MEYLVEPMEINPANDEICSMLHDSCDFCPRLFCTEDIWAQFPPLLCRCRGIVLVG